MKRVLLTGISGFVGSHVMDHLLVNTDWQIIGVASWKHKGVPERILESSHYQKNKDRVEVITHDLVAPFTEITKQRIGKVDYIINLASDSHVDRSITDPVPFVKNNVDLVLNVLEFAREVKPEVFIQFSTDEVYGSVPVGVDSNEWDAILPSNPYSASKAAQEAIAISYWRTFGVPVILTNTMNVGGEYQDKEKFIPLCIKKIRDGETITIHSYPDKKTAGSRFYIHGRNVADALLFILNNLPPKKFQSEVVDRPDRYNVVGEREIDNLSLAQMIAGFVGKPLEYELVDFHSSRSGHDCRYALSGKKLDKLGWRPKKKIEEWMRNTVEWYLDEKNSKWLGA